MAIEHDDYNDPGMTDLLQRWGSQVNDVHQPRSLFPVPADEVIDQAFGQLDGESSAPRSQTVRRPHWIRPALALAAALVLLLGGWWLLQQPSELIVAGSSYPASTERVLRSEEISRSFHSGDAVYIHFDMQRPAVVAVAVLDSQSQFGLIAGAEELHVQSGHQVLGPFVLDEHTGTESFLLIACEADTQLDRTRRLIADLSERISDSATHQQNLERVLEALHVAHVKVTSVTIEHLPAR